MLLIDLPDQTCESAPRQSIVVPNKVVHRIRAVIPLVEPPGAKASMRAVRPSRARLAPFSVMHRLKGPKIGNQIINFRRTQTAKGRHRAPSVQNGIPSCFILRGTVVFRGITLESGTYCSIPTVNIMAGSARLNEQLLAPLDTWRRSGLIGTCSCDGKCDPRCQDIVRY